MPEWLEFDQASASLEEIRSQLEKRAREVRALVRSMFRNATDLDASLKSRLHDMQLAALAVGDASYSDDEPEAFHLISCMTSGSESAYERADETRSLFRPCADQAYIVASTIDLFLLVRTVEQFVKYRNQLAPELGRFDERLTALEERLARFILESRVTRRK